MIEQLNFHGPGAADVSLWDPSERWARFENPATNFCFEVRPSWECPYALEYRWSWGGINRGRAKFQPVEHLSFDCTIRQIEAEINRRLRPWPTKPLNSDLRRAFAQEYPGRPAPMTKEPPLTQSQEAALRERLNFANELAEEDMFYGTENPVQSKN